MVQLWFLAKHFEWKFFRFFVAGSNETISFSCDITSFKISNNAISISSLYFHAFSSDPRFPFSSTIWFITCSWVTFSPLAPYLYSKAQGDTGFIKILSHVIEMKLKTISKSDQRNYRESKFFLRPSKQASARIHRPSFRENKPKNTLVFNENERFGSINSGTAMLNLMKRVSVVFYTAPIKSAERSKHEGCWNSRSFYPEKKHIFAILLLQKLETIRFFFWVLFIWWYRLSEHWSSNVKPTFFKDRLLSFSH